MLEDTEALTNTTLNLRHISLFVVTLNLLHTPRVFSKCHIWGKTRFNADGFKWKKANGTDSYEELEAIDIHFGTDHAMNKGNSPYHDFCSH